MRTVLGLLLLWLLCSFPIWWLWNWVADIHVAPIQETDLWGAMIIAALVAAFALCGNIAWFAGSYVIAKIMDN